jgi:hypothetical protein
MHILYPFEIKTSNHTKIGTGAVFFEAVVTEAHFHLFSAPRITLFARMKYRDMCETLMDVYDCPGEISMVVIGGVREYTCMLTVPVHAVGVVAGDRDFDKLTREERVDIWRESHMLLMYGERANLARRTLISEFNGVGGVYGDENCSATMLSRWIARATMVNRAVVYWEWLVGDRKKKCPDTQGDHADVRDFLCRFTYEIEPVIKKRK